MMGRLSRGVLAGTAAYFFAGLLLVSGVLPPLAAAVLAAPFALLVPAGVGLIACFGWRRSVPQGVGRVQALLVAWLLGTLAIIYLFVLLERHALTGRLADLVLACLYVLGAVGCLRLRRELAPDARDRQTLRLVALVAVPLVIVQYIAEIPAYSEFPVLDLFQRTHFHKGALQFARFDLLNPFVADSYVPFQQLLLGLLARGAHVDPLLAEWVLPLVMAPLQVGTIFALASRLTKSGAELGVAIGLFLAMSSVTNPTNGQVATWATLLLLSFVLGPKEEDKGVRETLGGALFLLAAAATGLVLVRLPLALGFAVLLGAAVFASMPGRSPKASRAVIVAIVILAAISFHRGAMLFIPLVVVIRLAVALYSRIQHNADARTLTAISLGSVLLVTGMAAWILLQHGHRPQDEFGLWALFDFVLKPLTGKSMSLVAIDHDLAQGSGGRISLFEVARSLTLVGGIVGGLLFLRRVWPAFASRDAKEGGTGDGGPGVVLMMVCLALVAVALTGFPFVHRSAFLIAALLAVAIAVLATSAQQPGPVDRWHVAGSIGLVACMGGVLAVMALAHGYGAEPYLQRVSPLLFLLFAGAVALLIWCVRTEQGRFCLAAVLVVAVLFEVIASRAYFKPYAFMNQSPPRDAVFSHFGQPELATADTIAKELDGDVVLVSDPKTMALIGARSGLTSLVSFSNLNTMADDTRRRLVEFLRNVSRGAPRSEICSGLEEISDSHASSQLNYEMLRRLGWASSGKEALALLGYADTLLSRPLDPRHLKPPLPVREEGPLYRHQQFAIVVSPDTLNWIDHPSDPLYFPARRDIPELVDVLPLLGSGVRKVGNAFLLKVKCE